jgi:DNA-binding NarL/FixJ family response regulator
VIDCVLEFDPSETSEDQPLARARILLADDHAEFLALTAGLVESEFEVLKTFGHAQSLIDEAVATNPDLLVLDISMPGLSGIEAALQLRAAGCQSRIVFLTVHEDPDYLRSALATGALGYVIKRRLASDLMPALRAALAGQCFVSGAVARELES